MSFFVGLVIGAVAMYFGKDYVEAAFAKFGF